MQDKPQSVPIYTLVDTDRRRAQPIRLLGAIGKGNRITATNPADSSTDFLGRARSEGQAKK